MSSAPALTMLSVCQFLTLPSQLAWRDPLDSGLGGDGEDGPLDLGHHRGLAVRPPAEDGGLGGAGHCLVCVREGARHDGRDPGRVDGGFASQRCSEARVSGGVVI